MLTEQGEVQCSDTHFRSWLSGFLDGDGTFQIQRSGRGVQSFSCRCELRLRRDDSPVVYRIKRVTGLGRVFTREPSPNDSPGSKPTIVWRVSANADCAALVEILDCHPLLGKSIRDYMIWREAVLLLNAPRRSGTTTALEALRQELARSHEYRAQE
jgi:LAGLIDADG endonuclease